MTSPRVVIDLAKIRANTRALVTMLSPHGISVVGVTKAVCGMPAVAAAMRSGGAVGLGDSRSVNLARLMTADVDGPRTLIRSPMLSASAEVVRCADSSCNTELEVLRGLSVAAGRLGRTHRVVLMVELGDLREGIMPEDLAAMARSTLSLPHVTLEGIGTNLACQHGVVPGERNMAELSDLVDAVESVTGVAMARVSGGNSASLGWATTSGDTGRVDELRLGEAILLGREPLGRTPIPGLHTDAVTLVAEIIESKWKPSAPWGELGQNAAGVVGRPRDVGTRRRSIVALGRQDVDPSGLTPSGGRELLGASSDHIVVDSGEQPDEVGDEIDFDVDYGALLAAMTSPYVDVVVTGGSTKSGCGSA
ncbi:MAG: alanine/ornithine racemase family PLP-dependent enzyme [Actinomycetota bacterium]|nr:alanine/ornithine racemase family PLP-dependent enzyme [Actinomycetota bacterium]